MPNYLRLKTKMTSPTAHKSSPRKVTITIKKTGTAPLSDFACERTAPSDLLSLYFKFEENRDLFSRILTKMVELGSPARRVV